LLYSSRMNDAVAATTTIEPGGCVRGTLHVPGDKSISHRYAILAALAEGQSSIRNYAPGADCASTLSCLQALGAVIESQPDSDEQSNRVITIEGRGANGLQPTVHRLDAGNSGTTMRLLAGVLAVHPFDTTIIGDASLNRRPMRRIVAPLERMGARIHTRDGCPPLTIRGTELQGLDYESPVASAQVKSAVLLAGLYARGETWVRELIRTRDHTERALPLFGAHIRRRGMAVGLSGGQRLTGATLTTPGDFSSAAFWFVAAAALPGSTIEINHIGLNPTRTRLLDILKEAGASVIVEPGATTSGEPYGIVKVAHRELRPIVITKKDVPALIDELPALAALGTAGHGFHLSGAAELRAKESDRIAVLVSGLRHMGVQVDERPDGFTIHDGRTPSGGTVDASGDHRMAMAFAIAALGATGPTTITGPEVVDVSYPGFFEALDGLRQT
jgi:3-phosphoshikimate 1-carboxyvinyltransferase